MNFTKQPNLNSLWGTLIIEELLRNGVEYFCIAPGSRSAPLTAAAALNKRAKTFVHFDERGLAFHALGYVSATQKPAVLICTSGTAVANFLPAVIETSKKKLPLIVLTADRPPELQKTGADQTIDQPGIFGKYAKWEFTFPCPTTEIKPGFILTTIDQAVYQAKSGMPGIVHLNCMFREPLAPVGKDQDFSSYLKSISPWQKYQKPFTKYFIPKTSVRTETAEIAAILNKAKSGVIVAGKLSSSREQESVLKLARKLHWPVFPDITSGLRLGQRDEHVIHYYGQILSGAPPKGGAPSFDCVLHLGGRMTSKWYYQFIESLKPKNYIMVLAHPLRNDPHHWVSERVQSAIGDFCKAILPRLTKRGKNNRLLKLKNLSEKIGKRIGSTVIDFGVIASEFAAGDERSPAMAGLRYPTKKFSLAMTRIVSLRGGVLQSDDEAISKDTHKLSEIAVARIISRLIPKNSGLFLASSMPIRDMDTFGAPDGAPVIVGSNRGASGIDGTTASAVGFAKGLNRPTTLIIGDLAFLHDINSLAMVKDLKVPLAIIVVNNNGGGIFNFLPIAERKDIFEKYFATPHDLNLSSAGELFGLPYSIAESTLELSRSYELIFLNKKSGIIEVKSERRRNLELRDCFALTPLGFAMTQDFA